MLHRVLGRGPPARSMGPLAGRMVKTDFRKSSVKTNLVFFHDVLRNLFENNWSKLMPSLSSPHTHY